MTNVIDIYHGSDHIIEQPIRGEGKAYNDYGRGFYCTEYVELAKEWACSADNDGYANHFQLDRSGLSVLNLNAPEYNILNWLAILLENRKFNVADGLPQRAKAYLLENFMVDYKNYDIIMGYRANDSYFSYAGDFVNGTQAGRAGGAEVEESLRGTHLRGGYQGIPSGVFRQVQVTRRRGPCPIPSDCLQACGGK